MTTRPDHHEPLDDGERDLAALLRRAGPVDGPSPALDAKILAWALAAAAAGKPRRQGRLAWLGVPPALVTGMGVAAAAVLALGLVWQLRPQYGHSASEASPAAAGDEEVIIFAEPASSARAQANNPPPLPASAAADMAEAPSKASRVAEASAAAAAQAQAQANEARAKVADARAQQAEAEAAEADAAAHTALSGYAAAPSSSSENYAPQAFATQEAAEPAAEATTAAAPSAPAHKSHATYTTAARATAERRARPVAAAPVAAAPAAAAAPPPAAAPPAEDAATLDRIEVSGSRIRSESMDWSQVPVSADTHLPAAEWLERIRARRDGENLDDAKASLELFRRDYPRVRIPDDLRALLAADAR